MTHRAVVEDRNIPLIIIARILSLGIAPLALLHGWTIASSGRLIEGVVLAAIGVFASVCLFAVLSVLSALSELARVNRYRAERDDELGKLLTDVHRLLVAAGAGVDATQNRSGVFKSSQMPYTPENDGALTGRRPVQRE